jgi:uncharacterized protein (TIGR02598 family)
MKTISFAKRPGFSLVEVTLALGVAAFCLLSIFALLPAGLSSNQAAIQETSAGNLMSSIVADLRATPAGNATSPIYNVPLAGDGTLYLNDDGQSSPSVTAKSHFRCTITSLSPPGNRATCLRISISWPASADPNTGKPLGRFDSYIAIDQ